MIETIGTVVCRPFAGSGVLRPAVKLEDGTCYWISQPRMGMTEPADPGQRVRIRYVHGDQFCEVVSVERELSRPLGVHESQVSRDERNEYVGITRERAVKVLVALNVRLRTHVENHAKKPAASNRS